MNLNSLPDHLSGRVKEKDCGHHTPCWVWTGEINRNGYGTYKRTIAKGKRKRFMVHIEAYKYIKGDYGDGLLLDHLCCNRPCCNPDHLEPVTHSVNTRRGCAVLFDKLESYSQQEYGNEM